MPSKYFTSLFTNLKALYIKLNFYFYRLEEADHTIFVLADARKRLETDLAETEAVNQTLHDEHQALQIAFASMEEKLKMFHVYSLFLWWQK